eukprot:comp22438_c1_seq1/m.33691 comp22438_c1_seq1/g.33691  ORF comp22438_c1_seq1/g.33691 comp22438_c1_seq1/m.33691 type:complete len:349 (-) comp22438_c1_seq1:680-1726(-)
MTGPRDRKPSGALPTPQPSEDDLSAANATAVLGAFTGDETGNEKWEEKQKHHKGLRSTKGLLFMLVSLCFVLAVVFPSVPVSLLPHILIMAVTEKKDGKAQPAGLVYGIFSVVYTILFINGTVFLLTGFWIPVRFAGIYCWVPLLCVVLRGKYFYTHGPIGILIISLWFDPPLLATIFTLAFFGVRFLHDGHGVFLSDISDGVMMSSLPTPWDVGTLAAANVGAVVNMCAEYSGPVAQYQAKGIKQLHLPTTDTTQPLLSDLESAAAFIKEQVSTHPEKKVLVHCKGGRGRAASVVLCYLVSRGWNEQEALKMMKEKRPMVEPVVAKYPNVREFIRANEGGKRTIKVS